MAAQLNRLSGFAYINEEETVPEYIQLKEAIYTKQTLKAGSLNARP